MVDSLSKGRATVLPAMGIPRPTPVDQWSLKDVHAHLEYAVNLEMWTIPYYLTAMYSIQDRSDSAFRLVQSVVRQEMLHAELAANAYNSFRPARDVRIGPFHYTKEGGVPHLNFASDLEAVHKYGEPNACLGGLDLPRIGTMCLIELPESHPPDPDPARQEYATIGDFYTALRSGMWQHVDEVRGNRRQLDYFGNFYRNLSDTTVTEDGQEGLNQALQLIDVITEQGEGSTNTDEHIPPAFQNTADGYDASSSHFLKFNTVRDDLLNGRPVGIYPADPDKEGTEPQRVLVENFAQLTSSIQGLFNGSQQHRASEPGLNGRSFGALMSTVGANVLTCWRQGVVPRFSDIRSMA